MINDIKKHLKVFIVVFFVSFFLSFFYPVKNDIFLFFQTYFLDYTEKTAENLLYFNYQKQEGKFTVYDSSPFLVFENINGFVRNLEIKFKEKTYIPVNIFFEEIIDNDKNKTDIKRIYSFKKQNKSSCKILLNKNHKVKNIFIYAGEKKQDSFILEKVSCNNPNIYLKNIYRYSYLKYLTTSVFFIRILLLYTGLFFVFSYFIFNDYKICNYIYKKRYYIGFFIILFVILSGLNNSSLGEWANIFNYKNNDIIFGQSKKIRTDEFAIFSAITISQKYNNYSYFGNILRGTRTDMFMIYGQPVKNIVSVFRPFLLGFVFLGQEKGFSFFWIVRLLLLFLISFEFLLLITRQNKRLSLLGAFLITFAPAVQWWWTPIGIADMIIYGELGILLLNNIFKQTSFIKRIVIFFIITIIAGSYILILYPAWQIPFMYIFVCIGCGVFYKDYAGYNFSRKDLFPISILSLLFAVSFIYIYSKSKETIDIMTHTVYPGARFETGGHFFKNTFQYWPNIFFAFQDDLPSSNVCEYSSFFDFFPAGIILSFIVLFKEKIKDKLLIILLCLDLFFAVYLFAGFPEILAKVTLLKFSPSKRLIIPFGFLNLIILIRSLSLMKFGISKYYAFFIGFILTVFSVIFSISLYSSYIDIFKICIIAILSFTIYCFLLTNKINKKFFLLIFILLFFGGMTVNPVQKGIRCVQDNPLLNAAKEINDKSPGLWLAESVNFPIQNSLILKGIPVFNSTNIYPNLADLKKVDKENKYENIYNRYATAVVRLVKDDDLKYIDKIVYLLVELFLLNLTVDDIIELNINYILTDRNLEVFDNDKVCFEKIFSAENKNKEYLIYKVKEKQK